MFKPSAPPWHGWVVGVCLVVCSCLALAQTPGSATAPATPQPSLTGEWHVPTLTEAEQQWLRQHPVIRVGVDPVYAPYSSLDEQNRFDGVAADFLRTIGAQLGLRFEVAKLRRWTDILAAAQRRDIDMVATVVRTPAREKYLAFSGIYLQTPLVVMAREGDHTLRTSADLTNRSVALVQGYSSTIRVLQQYPSLQQVPVRNPLEGLVAVATGQADAYVGAIGVNLALSRQYGINNLRVAAAYDITNGQRFGVRSDWPLLVSALDKALAAIPQYEQDRIHRRWVPRPVPVQVDGQPTLSPAEREWVKRHPRIRVGLHPQNEPEDYLNDQGVPSGLVAGYLDWLREVSGLAVDTVPVHTQAQALSQLVAGELDLVVTRQHPSQVTQQIMFTDPFEGSALAVFMPKASGLLLGPSALSGKRVARPDSLPLPLALARLAHVPSTTPTALAALLAVQAGQADAAILPVAIGHYLLSKHQLDTLQQAHVLPGEESRLRFATASDTLRDVVNLSLSAATAERIADIRLRALTLPREPRGVPMAHIAMGTVAAAVLVLGAFALIRRRAAQRLQQEVVQRLAADEAARRSEERFTATFEHAAVGIAQVAPDGSWLKVNRQLCHMLGYTEAELLNMTFQDLTHPDDLAADLQLLQRLLAGDIPFYALEKRYLRKKGETLWGLLTVSLVHDQAGQPAYFVSVVEDITQRKADEARIHFLAFHDDLTQLPNRALMADRATACMAHARRSATQVALLYLDLDHFKEVNDTLGHSVGDQLLVTVTERLKTGLRASDSLGRHGGDEFLVLLPELAHGNAEHAASATANKLLDLLRQPFEVGGNEIAVNTSIGVALFPDDGQDFETLLRKADTALYAAKGAGRGQYRFFAEEMNLAAADYESIRNGIRFALERGQLSIHYQPQADMDTLKVTGAEALLRWNHPVLGNVPPGRFIPIAEDSGMLVSIGAWVIGEACRQAKAWQAIAGPVFKMAVNLSATQFRRSNLLHTVTAALQATGLSPASLELELTESILIQDTAKVLSTLQDLRTLGVELSIDDFGTGYSSLSYLKKFPVHKLKIDQSFVRDMVEDPDASAIVLTIIGLASTLRLTTIAEGVETPAQLAMLRDMGCQQLQGYLLGKPMPAEEFARCLSAADGPRQYCL